MCVVVRRGEAQAAAPQTQPDRTRQLSIINTCSAFFVLATRALLPPSLPTSFLSPRSSVRHLFLLYKKKEKKSTLLAPLNVR